MNRVVANLLRAKLLAQVPKRTKAYTGPLKDSMDDLPQPGGNWKAHYDSKKKTNTAQLLLGCGFISAVMGFCYFNGLFYNHNTGTPVDKNTN